MPVFSLSDLPAEARVDATGSAINALSPSLAQDGGALVPGCGCYACMTHSRAYTRHLLNTTEMLGPALLQVHNVHHYAGFFTAMRKAIAGGQWDEYVQWFKAENSMEVPAEAPSVTLA